MSSDDTLHDGLVVAAHGRHYFVEDNDGQRRLCHPRGKRSDAVVGDRVRWRVPAQGRTGEDGVIESLQPRRNLLYRQDERRSKSFAANLDQLLMLVAVEPMFGESQLARALIAASAAGIDARIVLNKTDLPGAADALERLQPYAAMGYGVTPLSLKADPVGSNATLWPWLQGRATLVLGPSGSGKSTLINATIPRERVQAQVGEISQALNSGRHTTTTTQWYWLDDERRTGLIDSPGFQAFGLRHIDPTHLAAHMPDLSPHAGSCRFYNCTHRHEPGCGVRAALAAGKISPSRHRIYVELFEEFSGTYA